SLRILGRAGTGCAGDASGCGGRRGGARFGLRTAANPVRWRRGVDRGCLLGWCLGTCNPTKTQDGTDQDNELHLRTLPGALKNKNFLMHKQLPLTHLINDEKQLSGQIRLPCLLLPERWEILKIAGIAKAIAGK